ncbi:RloB family protein [Nonomuraea sp. CA-143628]|uniref:RloB family protein n=1 Tax=Nonomuraea sp. CA-143628 TaxID=3239997 RepID=UPI003D9369AC
MRSRRGPQIDVDMPEVDHLSIVREACTRKSHEYSAVWCVLDTELDQSLADDLVREASRTSVELCLSTPCFEFWLIMHHVDCTRPFQSAEEAKKKLKSLVPSWSEGTTRFSDFSHGLEDACRRARKIDPTGREVSKNPSTNAWRLVTELRAGLD